MEVKVITPPATLITPTEMKLHLRVHGTDEDTLLATYLLAAQEVAKLYSGRSIGQQTLELALDSFPTGNAIELPYGPVSSITSVSYTDPTTLVTESIAVDQYFLDNYGPQSWAIPIINGTWPSVAAVANSIKIRYVAGDLPTNVKLALLMLVGHFYENREAAVEGTLSDMPFGVKMLLDVNRIRLGLA